MRGNTGSGHVMGNNHLSAVAIEPQIDEQETETRAGEAGVGR